MRISVLATWLLCGVAVAGPALAQPAPTLSAQPEGSWRGSKLIGLPVYNDRNEKLGEVNEVFLDPAGRAQAVVIGLGGVLGLGEHYVAVPFASLQWPMTPVPPPASNPIGTAPTVEAARNPNADLHTDFPDHAVLPGVSSDELGKAAPFRYSAAPR